MADTSDHALALQLQQQEADSAGLTCTACTFLNSSQRAACEVCGTPLRGGGAAPSRRKQRSDASHLLNFEQVRREEVRRVHPVARPSRPARRLACG